MSCDNVWSGFYLLLDMLSLFMFVDVLNVSKVHIIHLYIYRYLKSYS